jgi:hypothetical protein
MTTQEQKQCPKCQQPVDGQATQCDKCGHVFRAALVDNRTRFQPIVTPKAQAEGNRSTTLIRVAIVVVALVVIALVWLGMHH